jgi:multicomponent Na+:H+ antiporter subunit D
LGGLYDSSPVLAVLFFIPAMSLAGIPPLSGFFAKVALVQAGLATEHYALVGVALIVSTLTLLSMAKVWAAVFWKASPISAASGSGGHDTARPVLSPVRRWGMLTPIAALTLTTVLIGVVAEPVFTMSQRAADQLLDPTGYIEAVLGVRV